MFRNRSYCRKKKAKKQSKKDRCLKNSFIKRTRIQIDNFFLGRNDCACDNIHSGWLFVVVSNDGTIISNGKTESNDNFECHPGSDIKFIGYKIKNTNKVIDAAKRLQRFPHM